MSDESGSQNPSALDRYLNRQPGGESGQPKQSAVGDGAESNRLNLNISSTPQLTYEPAGFWRRFAAYFIDGIILGILEFVIKFPLDLLLIAVGLTSKNPPKDLAGIFGANFFFGLMFWAVSIGLYYGWFYVHKGATPGKMLLGLKVIDAKSGTHITYMRAFGRESIGKICSYLILLMGFFMALLTDGNMALHDWMFSTRVVRVKDK